MLKKFTLCALALLLLLSGGVNAFAAPEKYTETPDGVVLIEWSGSTIEINPDTKEVETVRGTWHGAGFFVGDKDTAPQYIVTNYHVIENFLNIEAVEGDGAKANHPIVIIYGGANEQAYVVDYDADKDLAILKLSAPTTRRVPLALRKSSGELRAIDVWAVGYPASSSAGASYGKDDATFTKGTLGRTIVESGTGRTVYQTDVKLSGGNSGGPLVDIYANVIGVNTFSVRDLSDFDPALYYAVSSDDLIPLLNRNSIPFYTNDGAPEIEIPEEKPFSLFDAPYIYICAAVIVVIAAGLVIFFLSKGKGKSKTGAIPTVAAQTTVVVPGKAPGNRKPVLHSVSAQHNGAAVELGKQPIMVGRDVASCRIVFREGTTGVSSRHCEVSYDEREKVFVLVDLKSTYGTFLSGGQKLTPSVPYHLNARDSFYLGEADNALYVDFDGAD
ncbi:MAG: trypsin-like peptidase domain-containing protein [Oscillospiraceae bacterium]|jgi:hypothetical protein|nr:trypsin-like peptidase domain-containing protein [Oscillospiraceae bacterium]